MVVELRGEEHRAHARRRPPQPRGARSRAGPEPRLSHGSPTRPQERAGPNPCPERIGHDLPHQHPQGGARGLRRLLHLNWPLVLLLTAIACVGFLTLYSLAGGSAEPWMASQVKRFGLGLCVMLAVAMTPIWVGTALLVVAGGGAVMFLAGVPWLYFATVLGGIGGLVALVMESRGTPWQLLKAYQYRRIDIFLDSTSDPLGAGYNIAQAKIALGSGGWSGRGYVQGTQTRLNFLPNKHTGFILTAIGEELGFLGTASLLGLYMLTLVFGTTTGLRTADRFGSLLALGMVTIFINMGMVMGMLPVVGVPLVSYGGSAMIALMVAFGVSVTRPVTRNSNVTAPVTFLNL
ncbi:FtsW/RodA/SpoVE family cell cycle protein [Yangia sp. PrR004]|nr:FtsW/RodA/SpoVE family cell cycle protein [Salipiger sp. PrR004]